MHSTQFAANYITQTQL